MVDASVSIPSSAGILSDALIPCLHKECITAFFTFSQLSQGLVNALFELQPAILCALVLDLVAAILVHLKFRLAL